MSKSSTSHITINVEFWNRQEILLVQPNQNLLDLLIDMTEKEVFAVCYGDNQIVIPTEINLVAKRSSEDSSKASIFYRDIEIIPFNESTLTIKLERISFNISGYKSHKFDYALSTTFAILIQDKTCKPPVFMSFYGKMSTWKKELRKKLKSDTELVFVDPTTSAEVKVFLGPEELKNGVHDLEFCDKKDQSHHVFVSYSNDAQKFETLQIENESFSVINIWTISKFILKRPPTSKGQLDVTCNINPDPVLESFKAKFNPLKLNSVDFIRAHASVYSFLYKECSKYYAPMACLCQCSGAGKSKSATTALKETLGFYVCLRDRKHKDDSFAVPKANSITNALLDIFQGDYKVDSFENQADKPCKESTVGKCLMFVTQSIKSYIVAVSKNTASKLVGNENEATLELKLLTAIKEFSSKNFESSDPKYKFYTAEEIQGDFLKAGGLIPEKAATVSNVIKYIHEVLKNSVNCFRFDNELEKDSKLEIACKAISTKITVENPFLFFIDEAGLLAKKDGKDIEYVIESFEGIPQGKFSAFQIFRRALSYLDIHTNIFFFALGTKSTIEELSPPIIDNSMRGLSRKDFFPPIIVTQDFDIWREKYPLNEMVPCYKSLLNCCTFKFLATLGHPLFSSLNFNDIVKLAVSKLYNGSRDTDKTYLLATWMIRGGLACDPKSVLAESLVENHMATLFNIRPLENCSSKQSSSVATTFGNVGLANYDITYQSTPCLALGAREASLRLSLEKRVEFFHQLEIKIESMVVDRGKLGEATGGLLTALLIDDLPNIAEVKCTLDLIAEMKTLTPEKFHPLWDSKGSLLCPDSDPLIEDLKEYKVVKVESFLKKLMGDDDFERVKHTFPLTTLNGLLNASHFVSISRYENEGQSLANANDLVPDKYRNVITMDRLRLALTRQCGLIMPPNYYGIDAIIPICLATEEVIDPDGNVTIKDVNREDRSSDIPYAFYDPVKHPEQNRYRPIYSFLAIQYKSGRFDLDVIPKMQARLHVVPCANFSVKNDEGVHRKCNNCLSVDALEEVFNNQISLLYCFLSKDESNGSIRNQFTVNYGNAFLSPDPSPVNLLEKKKYFLKTLYPNINENDLSLAEKSNAKLLESTYVRTFEQFMLRHRIMVNENVELVNIRWDDSQGSTYRSSDLSKWDNDEQKRIKTESLAVKRQKRKIEKDAAAISGSDKLKLSSTEKGNAAINTDNSDNAAPIAPNIQIKIPDPICPTAPFDKSRMNTVIINGWKPWEYIIGSNGVIMADKLFREFVQDPVRNVKKDDLKTLMPSLKIIMSSKLLGQDRYLESQPGQDDLSKDEWLLFLFEKFQSEHSPANNNIYKSAKEALEDRKREMELD